MEPDTRSPSETDDAARVAVAPPEMDAAAAASRRSADTRWRIRFLFGRVLSLVSYALPSLVHVGGSGRRDGIADEAVTDPRRRSPPARRQLDPRGGDTAPQSEGRDDASTATSNTTTTTRRPGTAHAARQREGRGRDDSTASDTTTPSYPSSVAARDSAEAPAYAAIIGLLAYGSCVVVGLVTEFDHTVGGWIAAATISYGLLLLLAASLLGFGVMASVAGSSTMLWVSDLCARLGAILCTALLIVVISCKMGKPWGCAAGVPFAAVVACAMGAIGTWGRARALWDRVVGPSRRRKPPGGDENV
ncbi:unnamed protein product [Urochloa decumbens]|uniref:Uncharacterized protein n=1 Tax=Urochloa decumbens TaxID=240449 RepID=A0ABC8VI55_9POAL